MTIKAFDPTRLTNARAIADLASLSLIGGTVLDMTHNQGRFWRMWQPETLVRMDLDPLMPVDTQADLRALPFRAHAFDSVVLDPPYKLNGTGGSCAEDAGYGVSDGWTDRRPLYALGLVEALRVCKPKGTMLVKFQDQIAGGKLVQQSFTITQAMATKADLLAQIHVLTTRQQPAGRPQKTPRNNYSTFQVWRTNT